MKPEMSICSIPIPKHLIRYSYETTELSDARKETVFIKRTAKSETMMEAIREAVKAGSPDEIPFMIDGKEWLGTFSWKNETDLSGFIIQLRAR